MEPYEAYKILKNKTYKDDAEKQNLLNIIKKEPEYAYRYAKYVIQGRWPEAEPYIKTHPQYACCYAGRVIKGRFPEAEPYIKTDPYCACDYAIDVIKGRWIEFEDAIKKKKKGVGSLIIRYCSAIDQAIPELERLLTTNQKIKFSIKFGHQISEETELEITKDVVLGSRPSKMKKAYIKRKTLLKKLSELSKEEIIKTITSKNLIEKMF